MPLRLPLRMSLVPMGPADEMTARSQLGGSQLLLSSVEGDASFREADLVQLDEDSAFYLPPLVVTLLSSFCKDVGNRAVRNYIKHHRPLQKARAPRPNSGRCPHIAPRPLRRPPARLTPRKASGGSLGHAPSVGAGRAADGVPYAHCTYYTTVYYCILLHYYCPSRPRTSSRRRSGRGQATLIRRGRGAPRCLSSCGAAR